MALEVLCITGSFGSVSMMRDYFEWLKCFMFLNRERSIHQLICYTGMNCCRKVIVGKKEL